jgi:Chlamydia polymorphic membrane protein (Chlamydia_PMP) repeat
MRPIRARLSAAAAATGLIVALLPAVAMPTAAARPDIIVCPSCTYSSVQAAIDAAASGDTIAIEQGTYDGPITISKIVTLEGAGASQTTIRGGSPVLTVAGATLVTLEGLTITGGTAKGGIQNGMPKVPSFLTLIDSTVSGNSAVAGGGINNLSNSSVVLRDSTVSGNTADAGGGIFNAVDGYLTLSNSTVSGNTADYGGGIYNPNAGTMTLKDSTVSGNTAGSEGGGIYNDTTTLPGVTLTLKDSTVSGNTPDNCATGSGAFAC